MNIFYIGSSGALSLIPFERLLSSGHDISAVGVYKPIATDNKVIALENASLALAANQSGIPVIDLSQPASQIIEQCSAYSIDVILMSCYGKRLPAEIIQLAAKGCYNMHPSLLPRFRGPEPIFWQMKLATDIGVSWHQVVHDFDAGDVVAQQKVILDDGLVFSEINLQLAEIGSQLMLKLLSELVEDKLTHIPQNPDIASYYPYPEKYDFQLDDKYTAQQLFNFMCATYAFGYPYLYQFDKRIFHLVEALDYDNNRSLDTIEVQGNRLYIPCNEGVLIVAYTDKMSV